MLHLIYSNFFIFAQKRHMKPKRYNGPSPIELISREIQNRKLRNVDVSKMLKLHPSSITVMLTRQDISVYKLISCCYAFRYNFLQELANSLALPGPSITDMPHISYPGIINQQKKKSSELERKNLSLQAALDEANHKLLLLELEHKTVKEILNKLLEAKSS